jgi:hypothetical protein
LQENSELFKDTSPFQVPALMKQIGKQSQQARGLDSVIAFDAASKNQTL